MNNNPKYQYTTENAKMYQSLGIKGTTYELGYNEMRKMLGNLNGKTFLDFGSGAGRSTKFLKSLGAKKVIGVDHDKNMVAEASKEVADSIEYVLIKDEEIPLEDNSVDGAISTSVFIEIRSMNQMEKVCKEMAGVVKPRGVVVIMSTSQDAFGHDFKNFKYTRPKGIQSGELTICTVKNQGKTFDIEDTYWEEKDYRSVLEAAGLRIEEISYPKGNKNDWSTEESKVAPFIVIKAIKGGDL